MQIQDGTFREPRKAGALLVKVVAAGLLSVVTAGCRPDQGGPQLAGWTLIEPAQRHPILVSQQPANLSLRVASNSDGLTPVQRARVMEFVSHSKAVDAGNSRIVISAPGGSSNEGAAMQAADDARQLMLESGYPETAIAVEAYHAGGGDAPLRISYLRYVADAPDCGQDWSENLASAYQNTPYPNFGCAAQRNLAMMVANPADLLGPRTMTARDANRRDNMYGKYVKGEPLGAAGEVVTIQKPNN